MESSPRESLLTEQDIARVFGIVAHTGNPEPVCDLVMSAYHVRGMTEKPLSESLYLTMYDKDWEELDKHGITRPDVDDVDGVARFKTQHAEVGWTNLVPERLMLTREEIVEHETAVEEEERAELTDEALKSYEQLTKEDSKDADYLLSLVGAKVIDGQIEFEEAIPEKLAQVRRLFLTMNPAMRDFIRMNLPLFSVFEPEVGSYIAGTEIENPDVKLAFETIKARIGNADLN